jgi:mono/diheme cytochrome c family protein
VTAQFRFAWPGISRPCLYLAAALLLGALPLITRAQSDPPTPQQIDDGRQVYEDFCMTCHGRDMVSPGLVIFGLRKFPRDDFPRFRNAILDGKLPAMTGWRDRLSNEDVLLWAYVRGEPLKGPAEQIFQKKKIIAIRAGRVSVLRPVHAHP